MEPGEVLVRFDHTLEEWRRTIGGWDDAGFRRAPAKGGWCAGQVVHHVALVGDYLVDNALACAEGSGERRRWAFLPAVMFAIGSFPPIRVRLRDVPDDVAAIVRPEPVDRERARQLLSGLAERMHAAGPRVASAAPDLRRCHFAAGWWTGRQWFQAVEMHTRHHLRQLARLARP